MTLLGYTTDAVPGHVFSPDELLDMLASPDNPTDFTHAMAQTAVRGFRGDDALSATTLTSTCPREYRLKKQTEYTLRLESAFYSIAGVLHHAMMEISPPHPAQKVIREKRYAKRFVLSDGREIFLPGRMDEIVLDYRDGKALVRDYKTTKSVPKYTSPYSTHLKQLNLYRMIVSDYPEPPVFLSGDQEFWEGTPQWAATEPIAVEYGEIVYMDKEQSKRLFVGGKARSQFDSIYDVYNEALQRLEVLLSDGDLIPYTEAVSSTGYGFGWKCESYCPVKDTCRNHWIEHEAMSLERAIEVARRGGCIVTSPVDTPEEDF